jgi:acyl-CoA reductase-like NAD-dependent aldehyde dehydrogenase
MKAYAYTQDKLFIGGEWVAPIDGEQVPSINPATGSVWALTAFGGKRDIDRAVEAAREAMRGPWGRMPPAERAALMRKLAGLLEANAERMAELETRDNGRPLRETKLNLVAEATTSAPTRCARGRCRRRCGRPSSAAIPTSSRPPTWRRRS